MPAIIDVDLGPGANAANVKKAIERPFPERASLPIEPASSRC